MSLSHVLFLGVALSGAVYAIQERGVASNLNMDLESGQLLLSTRAGDGEVKVVVIKRTNPKLNIQNVIALKVIGFGCFFLYRHQNFRGQLARVDGSSKESTNFSVINSIEYFCSV